MKKRLAFFSTVLAVLLISSTAWACPTCQSPVENPGCFAFVTLVTSVFWLPTAVVTSFALVLLRERIASTGRLIAAMAGSIPMSIASTLLVFFVLGPAFTELYPDSGAAGVAAGVGTLGVLQALYVALCYILGGGEVKE